MKKHRNKIIAAVAIIVILAGAWIFGGSYGKGGSGDGKGGGAPPSAETSWSAAETPMAAETTPITPTSAETQTITPTAASPSETPTTATSEATATLAPTPTLTPTPTPTPTPTKDQYLTDPVPEGKPKPVEPQDVTVGDGEFTVTLSVRCDTILDNMNLLDKEKHELVPEDGTIFPATDVTAYEGESVFNVLQREMRRNKIHMAFRNTPIYNSAYIEAINNLYEFDVGELSGWMYKVNDWFPNYGCSRYQLKPGDVVEWLYTCDLGRDLGEYWLGGGQSDG